MAASINYRLTNENGQVIDQSENGEFIYLHGANNIIPGLENALAGKQAGEKLTVTIQPAEAYGEKDPEQIQQVPREMFPADTVIEVGMQFHAQSPSGDAIVVTVVEADEEQVLVDGNHPLAGVVLTFDVEIVDVREATPEEITHGHIHGEGGCDH